jgi:hypothetical protein
MTPTSASNRDPACDRSLDMAQQPIAIAGSKGLLRRASEKLMGAPIYLGILVSIPKYPPR